jgi:hypothetical protein
VAKQPEKQYAEAVTRIGEAEWQLAETQVEARSIQARVAAAEQAIRQAQYDSARTGGRADVAKLCDELAAPEQESADIEPVRQAHADLVDEARAAKLQLILDLYPELMASHERDVKLIRGAREEMEARHAAERAAQDEAEVRARAHSRELLAPFPMFRGVQVAEEILLPVARPDKPSAHLRPFEPEPWWPRYLVAAHANSGGAPTKEHS